MRNNLVFMNWTVAPLSPEQQLVMRNVAALFLLREDLTVDYVDFTHTLIEGRLYRKNKGVFVTMAGTFFHADLGTVKGVRWTSDFLLPAGTESMSTDDPAFRVMFRRGAQGDDVMPVNTELARVNEASLLV